MKAKNIKLQKEIAVVQVVTLHMLNVILAVLYQEAHWERESLLLFDEKYRTMCRKARCGDKETLKQLAETKKRLNLEYELTGCDNDDIDRLMHKTWTQCVEAACNILEIDSTDNELWNMLTLCDDFFKAENGDKEIVSYTQDIMQETMEYIYGNEGR